MTDDEIAITIAITDAMVAKAAHVKVMRTINMRSLRTQMSVIVPYEMTNVKEERLPLKYMRVNQNDYYAGFSKISNVLIIQPVIITGEKNEIQD